MPHWKSFHIDAFRRLRELHLEDLADVNILVGKNNSGKTSLLEALAVAGKPGDIFRWLDVGRERELKSARTPPEEVLEWFFPRHQPRTNGYEGSARFSGEFSDGQRLDIQSYYKAHRVLPGGASTGDQGSVKELEDAEDDQAVQLEIRLEQRDALALGMVTPSDPIRYDLRDEPRVELLASGAREFYPVQIVTPVSHRTNRQMLAAVDKLMEDRVKSEVLDLLKGLAPDVEDLEIRSPQGRAAVIHLYHRDIGHVPLSAQGDGMRRALAFATAAVQARNGILLLDEVETALHPGALEGVFRFLVASCRRMNVQLFATTHSLEAVDALLAATAGDAGRVAAYRLPPQGSAFPLKRFADTTLREIRQESGLDLR